MSRSSPGEDEELVALASALRASVVPLSRALRATSSDLTPTQLSVLGAIYRNDRISMSELADRERLSPAMISRVVSSLVDRGFVGRITGDEDRRICRVQVTADGHAWIEQSRVDRNAWLADRLACLTAEQRKLVEAAAPLLEALVADHRDTEQS